MKTPPMQRTIRRPVSISGFGFFGGSDVEILFKPAGPDEGITFVRTDFPIPVRIPARIEYLADRRRRTALEHRGATVEMTEHVMAALAGLGIDNCEVHLNAPETPGCDGSSRVFVDRLLEAGLVDQQQPRRPFVVQHPVCVSEGDSILAASPFPGRLAVNYVLDYGPDSPIGWQRRVVDVTPETFRSELASSRTFLLAEEAQYLQSQGIGTRVEFGDVLTFGPEGVIGNRARFEDECVRHKILDLIGDLALLGSPVEGHIIAIKSGHRLNAALVRRLLETHRSAGEVPAATVTHATNEKTIQAA